MTICICKVTGNYSCQLESTEQYFSISAVSTDHHHSTETSCMSRWDGLIPPAGNEEGGRSMTSHEAATLCYGSQALQVMNCLRDIYPSQGGIAVVQHGTATAAVLWLAISLPSRFPGTQRNPSLSLPHALNVRQCTNISESQTAGCSYKPSHRRSQTRSILDH